MHWPCWKCTWGAKPSVHPSGCASLCIPLCNFIDPFSPVEPAYDVPPPSHNHRVFVKLHFPFLRFLLSSNPALDPAKRSHGHSVDSLCVLGGGRLDESCACLPPPHMHHLAVLRSGAASVLMTRNEWMHGGICRNTSSKATAKASLSIQVPPFWSLLLPVVPAQLTGWSSLGDPRPRQLPRNIPSPFLRAGLSPEALLRSWWGSLVPDPPVTAPRATSTHSCNMETVPGTPKY